MDTQLTNNLRIVAHVLLGSCLGFFSACIFLMLYYFTVYTIPISEHLRFNNALWDTFYIDVIIFVILFFRDIRAYLQSFGDAGEDTDEIE